MRGLARMRTLLVANRGEIALRVMRAAAALDVRTVAIYETHDRTALHVRSADSAVPVGSYLDAEEIVGAALSAECDAVHPGYGMLSESAVLARRCAENGIAFVGPSAATLAQLT